MSAENKTKLEIEQLEKQIQKLDLEKDKISLENKELKRIFWKKPQWFASAITAFVAIVSVFILNCNGTFDKKYQQYKAEKAVLELDIKEFQIKKTTIDSEYNKKSDSLSYLKDSLIYQKNLVRNFNDTISQKNLQLNQLQKEKKELDHATNILNNNLKSRDQELFAIVSNKQKYEKKMSDSIIKLQTSSQMDNIRLSQRWQIDLNKYRDCMKNTQKLLDEIKSLKINN